MNTIVQVLLAQAFNLVEYLIQTEGPAVLNWVLAEVAALEGKYAPKPTPPVTPPAS